MKLTHVAVTLFITLISLTLISSNWNDIRKIKAEMTDIRKDSVLRHVVLFKFKEATLPEKIAEIEAAFADLPNKIPEIYSFEWGLNNSPEGLNKGLTHCFLLTFKSEADRDTYLPHPDHKAFGALLTPHLEDVTVVDYWAK
ncbi:Dabb family protein [Aggregatimonas sangjinii]|uniref:Dabb family protein n=1 Tax=Aggregatimonas sangjinii TaxID=2583587 RepID=A0A5B7STX8_9FLAO|nr:Dabb family protein [Aggregatimonas sangjinii]QCX00799.1 Dabb family protein [Aggregatimonas sangjinii]